MVNLIYLHDFICGYSLTSILHLDIYVCSPTRPNPGGGGETCAETEINIFFSKVLSTILMKIIALYANSRV